MNRDKVKLKVIEVEGVKLDPKAKYIITFEEHSIDDELYGPIHEAIKRLIGDNFVLLYKHEAVTVQEIMPEGEE